MDKENRRVQIEAITDEVREFHPLLDKVLPKLPGVVSYEYTHGQFERGADFLLEVEDQSTRRRRIIGVVAKTGKIDGKRVSDVEEQIKECAEERHYKVMQRVRCSEVWVFSTVGASERAKEKLEARFQGRTVEFFGSEDMATFVDEHYPYFWEQLPYDLGAYYQALTKKLSLLAQTTSVAIGVQEDAPTIELDVFERVRRTYVNNSTAKPELKTVDFQASVLQSKVSLLEAEMGFGKSGLARKLANHLASSDTFKRYRVIPVFSSYKAFLHECSGRLSRLLEVSLGASAAVLDDESLQVLVILDGLDECNGNGISARYSELFDDVLGQLKELPRVNILITSRPLKSLVDKAALYGEARTFGIRPVSLQKLVSYLETSLSKSNLPKRLFEDLKRSALFKQLPHSPIAAALFSNLLARRQQEVPQGLTELYAKSMDLMLGRWDQNKNLATEKQFTTAALIAEHLASYFVDNHLIWMSREEAMQMVKNYLDRRNTGVSFEDVASILFDRASLFTVDDELGVIAFRHRSFGEFLCAKKKQRDKSLNVKEAALKPYWTNVFFFYSGLGLDCADLLTELQAVNPKDEGEEWMKALAVPNYLLAAFATEFAVVESTVKTVLIDVARLYLKVRRGETKTRLAELSEMRLLYLFKSIMVESFSYEFYRPAFQTTALELGEISESQDLIHYAQFFIGCAAFDQGDDSVFRYLVKDVGATKLPVPISLAIASELNASSKLGNSALLRYHRDRLQKQFLVSHKPTKSEIAAVQAKINDLYKKPINSGVANKSATRLGVSRKTA